MIKLKSKTHVWAIIKGIAGATLCAVPQFREYLDPSDYAIILAIAVVIDIFIRNITTQPIAEK